MVGRLFEGSWQGMRLKSLAAFLLILLETGLGLAIPLLVGNFVDQVQSTGLKWLNLLQLIVIFMAQVAAGAWAFYQFGAMGHHLVAQLRKRLMSHMIRLRVSFFGQNQSGNLASRVMADSDVLRGLVTEQLASMVSGTLFLLGSVVILWLLDWKLTCVLFGALILAAGVVAPIAAKLGELARRVQAQKAQLTGRITAVFSEIQLVKASGSEIYEGRRLGKAADELAQLGLQETGRIAWVSPLISCAFMGALVTILGYGGVRVGTGTLAIGVLVSFILYMFQVALPLVQMGMFFSEWRRAEGACQELVKILDECPEDTGDTGDTGILPTSCTHSLRFESVSFRYKPQQAWVVQDAQMHFPSGQMTALVGPSGGGKSTVLKLLLRFYEADSGSIFWGEDPLTAFQPSQWRRLVAYVGQDAPLLPGSISENLTYGLEAVTEEAMVAAAKKACIHDDIMALPDGYQTDMAERGSNFSGGQRQRLALARALLRDCPILLLDEATSHLDSETEAQIQNLLQAFMCGRTCIVVAHRLSTIQNADRTYHIEAGQVRLGNARTPEPTQKQTQGSPTRHIASVNLGL